MTDIGIGYIINYDPIRATVDIRTCGGSTFTGVPYDSSLGLYSTPIKAFTTTDSDGKKTLKKTGSFVIYATITDANIRILRVLNDDLALIGNDSGMTMRLIKGEVQDTLLYTMQEGETLVSAPGRIVEDRDGTLIRVPGAWAMFKNTGDALVSNSDTSAQVWLSESGNLDLRSVQYGIFGLNTSIQEEAAGILRIGSGPARLLESYADFDISGKLHLHGSGTDMELYDGDFTLLSQSVSITAGKEVSVGTPELLLSTKTLDVSSDEIDLYAVSRMAIDSAATLGISSVADMLIHTPADMNLSADSVDISAITNVKLSIGSISLEITEQGINITTPAETPLTVNNGEYNIVGTPLQGPLDSAGKWATLVGLPTIKIG